MSLLQTAYDIAKGVVDFTGLARGLPGRVKVISQAEDDKNEIHTVELVGDDPDTGETKFDCKFLFNAAARVRASSIKNFSIHDPQERGQGLGARVIANLLDVTKAHPHMDEISLTAELERGAFVWAKMGWLPNQTSFTKLQKTCQPKLDVLQMLLPEEARLGATTYGIFRDLLDSETSTDPRYIWPMVDSHAAYDVSALKNLQALANIPEQGRRMDEIKKAAQANGHDLTDGQAGETDRTLRFIRNLDLDGLSRDGKVGVAMTLFAWEQWKGTLSLKNEDQVARLESRLQKVHASPAEPSHERDTGHHAHSQIPIQPQGVVYG